MTINLEEKAVKEALKKIIDNNNTIPYKAQVELKMIIEMEHDPEKLLQECLLYMLSYGG
ncbi:hypothetical protein I5Q83_24975 [Enterocloster clostridioformis]|nr:hypothetical protein I5Q83_24975 [Enterocloster clostridioformis]